MSEDDRSPVDHGLEYVMCFACLIIFATSIQLAHFITDVEKLVNLFANHTNWICCQLSTLLQQKIRHISKLHEGIWNEIFKWLDFFFAIFDPWRRLLQTLTFKLQIFLGSLKIKFKSRRAKKIEKLVITSIWKKLEKKMKNWAKKRKARRGKELK